MKFHMYFHNGSANHGCEAIVRTTNSMLQSYGYVELFSRNPDEDAKYLGTDLRITRTNVRYNSHSLKGILIAFRIKCMNQPYAWVKTAYKSLIKAADKDTVALSIGGDNYCYDGVPDVLRLLNTELRRKGAKTVLWGCSIEPELLKDKEVVDDLSSYSLITARESITYSALKDAGVSAQIVPVSDPAFLLPIKILPLPKEFMENNTVGINISPMILAYSEQKNVLFDAYHELIKMILKETSMNIALIPHVVWSDNDDRVPCRKLFDIFAQSGRVCLIDDHNAEELKGYISRCRFFVGARTHATIAAYSTCVPTLVVGYSVKSRGIARDIFGSEENYVINTKDIKDIDALSNAFKYIIQNECEVREHLQKKMPQYISRANVKIDDYIYRKDS